MALSYADLAWIKIITFLIPLTWFGIVVIRRSVNVYRFELLTPLGFLFGLSSYIFFLNVFSFVFKPPLSIPVSYLFLVLVAFLVSRFTKSKALDFPKGKNLILVMVSLLFWFAILFFLIGKKIIFGGDIHLYYAIAKTFSTGNFPLVSPWQPDLSVGYHYGGSILLGAINWFTGLPFEFIHRFLAFAILLALVHTLLYFIKRHTNVFSLIIYFLIPVTFVFITGIFMLVFPVFPLSFPAVSNIRELLLWLSQLPSVHISFETWGAPVTVGLIVYFLHQFIALSQFTLLLVLIIRFAKKKRIFAYVAIAITVLSTAITNEAVFLPGLFVVILGVLVKEISGKTFRKNFALLLVLGAVCTLILVFQGGIVTDILLGKNAHLSKSISFYLPWSQIPPSLTAYHTIQQSSKVFKVSNLWYPLKYIHVGFLLIYPLAFILVAWSVLKKDKNRLVYFLLLIAAFCATLSYNYIVPRFKPADGNRSMILAYQFLGLIFTLFTVHILESDRNSNRFRFFIAGAFFVWVFGFSFLQPFAELYSQASHANLLKPVVEATPPIFGWISNNLPSSSRFLVVDAQAPSSQRNTEFMEKAGVLVPTFSSEYRAYTLESGPEYTDLVYTLNPSLMSKFGIRYLFIDPKGYANLPESRKDDLANLTYFTLVYEDRNGSNSRVYKVEDKYLDTGENLGGTFDELLSLVPDGDSVYIDTWEHESPWDQLRKSVIFTFKDRNPVFVWGPGAYLNVLADISGRPPKEGDRYDYLVLFKDTSPNDVCKCKADLVWSGIGNNVNLWKVIE